MSDSMIDDVWRLVTNGLQSSRNQKFNKRRKWTKHETETETETEMESRWASDTEYLMNVQAPGPRRGPSEGVHELC